MKKITSFFMLIVLMASFTGEASARRLAWSRRGSDVNRTTLQKLQDLGGLTFYKDYANSQASANADYSAGVGTATFTATRSASAPATVIDSTGLVTTVTSSNTPRFVGGYYDPEGFHINKGIMLEGASTNLIPKSVAIDDATWTESNTVADNADAGSSSPDGTATAPSLTASDVDGTLLLTTAVTARNYSVWLKRKTGTGAIYITANGGTTWQAV